MCVLTAPPKNLLCVHFIFHKHIILVDSKNVRRDVAINSVVGIGRFVKQTTTRLVDQILKSTTNFNSNLTRLDLVHCSLKMCLVDDAAKMRRFLRALAERAFELRFERSSETIDKTIRSENDVI